MRVSILNLQKVIAQKKGEEESGQGVGKKRWAEAKGGFVCRLCKGISLKVQSRISAEVC